MKWILITLAIILMPQISYEDTVKYIEIDCGKNPCEQDHIAACDAICKSEIYKNYDVNFRVLWFSTKHSWEIGMEPFGPSTYNHSWSELPWSKGSRPAGVIVMDPLPGNDPTVYEIPGDTNEDSLINDIPDDDLSIVIADLSPVKTGDFIDLGIGLGWEFNDKFNDKIIIPLPNPFAFLLISILCLILIKRMFKDEIISND